jgi:hypothetical protein
MCFVCCRQNNRLVTRHEVPCDRTPEIADADDCGCQGGFLSSSI